MNQQSNPTVIVSGIANYLENKYKRLWSRYIIMPNGDSFYLLDGIRIPSLEFESLYPIELIDIID